MKIIFSIAIIFIIISCHRISKYKEAKTFDNFIFSHGELYGDYSLKFTNNDTIFLQRRFPAPIKNFYSIITKDIKTTLDSFIYAINFQKLDTTYIQNNLEDGSSYKFYLTKNKDVNWSYVYGNEGPKNLYSFSKWFDQIKERQKFFSINSVIDFGDLRYILFPPINPPTVKH